MLSTIALWTGFTVELLLVTFGVGVYRMPMLDFYRVSAILMTAVTLACWADGQWAGAVAASLALVWVAAARSEANRRARRTQVVRHLRRLERRRGD